MSRKFELLIAFLTLLVISMTCFSAEEPVKVYILSGQSNMVGIGQVTGGGSRWGSQFTDIEVSVYEGETPLRAGFVRRQLGNGGG